MNSTCVRLLSGTIIVHIMKLQFANVFSKIEDAHFSENCASSILHEISTKAPQTCTHAKCMLWKRTKHLQSKIGSKKFLPLNTFRFFHFLKPRLAASTKLRRRCVPNTETVLQKHLFQELKTLNLSVRVRAEFSRKQKRANVL